MSVTGDDPEIAAKTAQLNTLAIAIPEGIGAVTALASRMSLLLIDPWVIKFPARTNKGMAIEFLYHQHKTYH